MATLLHDAVMNPAEGNVPRLQGGTVGDSGEAGGAGGRKVGRGWLHQPAGRLRSLYITGRSQGSQGALGF